CPFPIPFLLFTVPPSAPFSSLSLHDALPIFMGGILSVSCVGYLLLASAGLDDELPVAVGFAFVYLGLGAIAALGTDIVVGTAPASKSGSAASLSETVQELGITIGVAVLGSLTTAVYRSQLTTPDGLARDEVAAF